MVEVTTSERADAHRPSAGYEALSTGQGTPQVHVHYVHRDIFGNGIAIRSYGEIKIAAGEYVWAKELLMNTLQVLVLTPEIGTNNALGYMAQKAIWHKGEYLKQYIFAILLSAYSAGVSHDNYASIDIYDHNGVFQAPATGRVDGSIWLKELMLVIVQATILLSARTSLVLKVQRGKTGEAEKRLNLPFFYCLYKNF